MAAGIDEEQASAVTIAGDEMGQVKLGSGLRVLHNRSHGCHNEFIPAVVPASYSSDAEPGLRRDVQDAAER